MYDTIFLKFDNPTLKIYLWYPYSPTLIEKDCHTVEQLTNNLTITQVPKILIPNPLKVEVVLNPPTVIDKNSGSDIQVVKEIARILQTELIVSHSDKPFDFGYIHPNGTITGMFGAVYYQKTDLAIGWLLNLIRYQLLDVSYTYRIERFDWCVPQARKVPSWKQVFITMKIETWLLIFGTLVITTVLLWCFSLTQNTETVYKNICNCFFINFCVLLAACAGVWPKSKSMKILVLFWVIICLILDTMYSSKFISLVHLGITEKQIKTKEELLESNLEIWVKPSTKKFFGDSPSLVPFLQKDYKCCNSEINCVNEVAFSKNAAAFSYESFTSYTKNLFIGPNNLPLIYCFNSGIDVSLGFIGMKKGFVLKEYIDKFLQRFVESGLTELWLKQTYKPYKPRSGANSNHKKNIDFFIAPLFCWVVGLILASLVLVVEIFTNKCVFSKLDRYKNNVF
ncbi:hypothetical protein Zmor_007559 [Zophobas morio]|uniref:Ionotropic glutamate receptor C-terminal domain-containing protein n=1 Tax=Zophobas morio TaxID=2755281 RepID=A0AA38IXK2_9CUCU|nr:hypothetical protein Zmor_007559 [Zophobas morio]